MSKPIDRSTYLGAFREEMEEHLQALVQQLISLEGHPDDATALAEVFRRAHTIKGAARMMGFGHVADLAHCMEDVLDDFRAGRMLPTPGLLDILLTAVDLLRRLAQSTPEDSSSSQPDLQAVMQRLRESREAVAGPRPLPGGLEPLPVQEAVPQPVDGQPSRPAPRETVRVDVARVDTILNLAGELATLEGAHERFSEQLDVLMGSLEKTQSALAAGDFRMAAGAIDSSTRILRAMSKQCHQIVSRESELTRELHYEASTLRLLSMQAVFSLVPRAARDLAREEGKEVEVVLEGEDTEIDREVMEQVKDSVLHLVHNAVAHGIESPAIRMASGKPRVGRVRVAAHSRGEQVLLEVEDDGAGVDFRLVRDVAVRRGIVTRAEAETMQDAETSELLFLPGFSTSREVDDASGRGVGLDVVKSQVDGLKGRVRLETRPGRGTRVTLELPITLAFTRVLIFQLGSWVFGFPCLAVQGITSVSCDGLRSFQRRPVVEIDGRTVPVAWMQQLLGSTDPGPRTGRRWPALLLGPPERLVAFLVDRVISDENVVVKPLGPLLRRTPGVAGGFLLGSGRVALLLSASSLIDSAWGEAVSAAAPPAPRLARKGRRVLVVDDSVITRELERGILEAAGYQVETAADGLDALARLRSREYALVVSDVQMPRLDGFGLAAAIRQDRDLARLPVVIVSSRESDQDKRKGLELGVSAYVGKGSFDQMTLLDTIEQLIG